MKNQNGIRSSTLRGAGVLVFAALGYPAALNATTIEVSATSTGFFGAPNNGATLLTPGFTVSVPVSIEIEAAGIVTDFNDQGELLEISPNGVDFTSNSGDVLPLQEAQGIPPDTPTTILDALMGVFVPAATATLPNFIPEDAAKVGPGQVGIDASSLFLIGGGPFTFSAPGAGTLYLGVNDSFVLDNSGGFSVTTVPEPGYASLLSVGLGVGALAWRSRRGKRKAESA